MNVSAFYVQVGQVLLRKALLTAIALVHEAIISIALHNSFAHELVNLRQDLFHHFVQKFKILQRSILLRLSKKAALKPHQVTAVGPLSYLILNLIDSLNMKLVSSE